MFARFRCNASPLNLTNLVPRHNGADHENSHAWLRSLFPYNSLQEFEQAWHMGNYVLDRKTGEKSFEEMSIYVRVSRTHSDTLTFMLTDISWACTCSTTAPNRRKLCIGNGRRPCCEIRVSRWANSTIHRTVKPIFGPSSRVSI